jgi:hypothetical protein
MEYKKCEHCGEKLHVRTRKCPFCNSIVPEDAPVITDDEEINTKEQKDSEKIVTDKDSETKETIIGNIMDQEDIKDYVYKAEVRHSLEYTKPMSNALKVFITAFATLPVFGQVIGAFFGVLFLTYEDNDRKSFGKSLIVLSIIMFLFYMYSFMTFAELLKSVGIESIIKQLQ